MVRRTPLRVLVATEQRFLRFNDAIYADASGGYAFWGRYLDEFSSVQVVARVAKVASLPSSAVRADGEFVNFISLPAYIGPFAGLLRFPSLLAQTRVVSRANAAYILRVPGAIGTLLFWWLRARNWPFAVEVVGDPHDSLSPAALRKAWTRFLRPLAVSSLTKQVKTASCIAYVTSKTLQRSYPSGSGFSTHYSSIQLPSNLFELARLHQNSSRQMNEVVRQSEAARLIFVGSLSQRYKGLQVLLHAMRWCMDRGVQLELGVLGDGLHRPEYEQLAEALGLENAVSFQSRDTPGQNSSLLPPPLCPLLPGVSVRVRCGRGSLPSGWCPSSLLSCVTVPPLS